MSYIPLRFINDALGSEASAFRTVAEIVNALTFDKTVLANTLLTKGVIASPSESLIDLINKVVPLQVNFNLPFNENFSDGSFLDGILAESHTLTLFPATFETAADDFSNGIFLDSLLSESGFVLLTSKWNQVMTDNVTPVGYIASASSEDAGHEAFKAFDDLNATLDDAWLTAPSGMTTGYLQYQDTFLGAAVTEYKITSRNSASVGAGQAPKTWTLQGSNDGVSWTVVDTRTDVTSWTFNETKTFYFLNSTSYSYYKLDVTENNGNPDFLAIGELVLKSNDAYQTF